MPSCRPDVHCLRMVPVRNPEKALKLQRRIVREGLVFQVLAENICDRTLVSTIDEMRYVEEINVSPR